MESLILKLVLEVLSFGLWFLIIGAVIGTYFQLQRRADAWSVYKHVQTPKLEHAFLKAVRRVDLYCQVLIGLLMVQGAISLALHNPFIQAIQQLLGVSDG